MSFSSVQFSSVAQSCLTLCDPMNCSTPGLPVHHQLPEFTQTHVHWVGDAIQPSHPLSSPSSPTLSLSQHQSIFQWVCSSYPLAKVLELQHHWSSFASIFSHSVDCLFILSVVSFAVQKLLSLTRFHLFTFALGDRFKKNTAMIYAKECSTYSLSGDLWFQAFNSFNVHIQTCICNSMYP